MTGVSISFVVINVVVVVSAPCWKNEMQSRLAAPREFTFLDMTPPRHSSKTQALAEHLAARKNAAWTSPSADVLRLTMLFEMELLWLGSCRMKGCSYVTRTLGFFHHRAGLVDHCTLLAGTGKFCWFSCQAEPLAVIKVIDNLNMHGNIPCVAHIAWQ